MPARTDGSSGITCTTYNSSLTIPDEVLQTMRNDPRATLVLPTIEKYQVKERQGDRIGADEFWIICSTTRQTSRGPQTRLDFVLTCTFGIMGKYPVFIYGIKYSEELTEQYLEIRIMKLVRTLAERLPDAVARRRVYSVFAATPVADAFARRWTEKTGIDSLEKAYYDAKFSYCLPHALAGPLSPSRVDHSYIVNIRPGVEADILAVSDLCYGFAAESAPFTLTPQDAIEEAANLIRARQLWVLEAQHTHPHAHSQGPKIACIVALTRATRSVTTITKVYTPPEWRNRKFAFRLVRNVCEHLFRDERKDAVVLYVGNDNPAMHVYNKVGFVGLGSSSQGQSFKHVEDWLEIGFDRSKIELGHW